MITIKVKGSFKNTERFLKNASKPTYVQILSRFGDMGVEALRNATPVRSGLTASSWSYEIEETGSGYSVIWKNSNINQDVNVALILQYGHGTGTGGYVQGIDYINPALHDIFDEMADAAWKEITK